jgi:POT family proton-dependent oligopeptide transporter
MIITIFQSTAFYQVFNVNPIWIQQHVALDVGGFRIPVSWFQSIKAVSSVLCVPLVFWIWRRQALRASRA